MQLDDETAARIQEFTTWAANKGYHVIGGLIGRDEKRGGVYVKVFSTTPGGSFEAQTEHAMKMVDALYHSVHHCKGDDPVSLPLGTN